MLQKNKFNNATTIYYLMQKRKERGQLFKKQCSLDFTKSKTLKQKPIEIEKIKVLPEVSNIVQNQVIIINNNNEKPEASTQNNSNIMTRRNQREEHSTDVAVNP